MKAYVFVTVDGEATEFASALRVVPGVIEANATTGEIDAIVVCEADDLLALSGSITRIQRQPGVIKAITRIVISLPAEPGAVAVAA
jgi:DNA-binding Lrp family transcriptional regulator